MRRRRLLSREEHATAGRGPIGRVSVRSLAEDADTEYAADSARKAAVGIKRREPATSPFAHPALISLSTMGSSTFFGGAVVWACSGANFTVVQL
ncbi:hypothetical protein OESDEN_01856 [Oesophagostomum dentatum]|uniref:Uncharacterized protein n=1 Tax=Oesophagostomum dentatum TaxID=61180 RepID=A0A0B1TQU8_OESDE|nr:hypothetical protein OESDEN_01856 [Oesophagostomum dentatum]